MDPAEYDLMDAVEDGMWWYRAVHARLLDALARRSGVRGLPLLDAGCGTGGFLARLAASALPGRPLVGLDYNPRAARRAGEKSGAATMAGTVNALPFRDGAFGAALSVDVLCHQSVDEAEALSELRRVLAPGGTLVLNLPAFEWMRSTHDLRVHTARRYTAPGLRGTLERAGFAEVETRYWNSLLFPLMVLQRKVLSRKEDGASDVAPFPPWLDVSFGAVTELERRLSLGGMRWPAGGSVMAVATRRP